MDLNSSIPLSSQTFVNSKEIKDYLDPSPMLSYIYVKIAKVPSHCKELQTIVLKVYFTFLRLMGTHFKIGL